jgi:hypothetical protein
MQDTKNYKELEVILVCVDIPQVRAFYN